MIPLERRLHAQFLQPRFGGFLKIEGGGARLHLLRTNSSTSRTTCPARRIFSISWYDFSTTATKISFQFSFGCQFSKNSQKKFNAVIN